MTDQFVYLVIPVENPISAVDYPWHTFIYSEMGSKLARYVDDLYVIMTSHSSIEIKARISRSLSPEDRVYALMAFGGSQPSAKAQLYGGEVRS